MSQQLLRLPEVRMRTGLSRSTLYSRIAQKRFPSPIPLGSTRVVGWLSSEVEMWIAEQVRAARPESARGVGTNHVR